MTLDPLKRREPHIKIQSELTPKTTGPGEILWGAPVLGRGRLRTLHLKVVPDASDAFSRAGWKNPVV